MADKKAEANYFAQIVWKPTTSAGFAINYNKDAGKGEFVGLFCDKMDDPPSFDGKIGKNCHDPVTPGTAYYNKCFNTMYNKQITIKRKDHGAVPLDVSEGDARTL